ncbi:hypothetical protein CVT25_010675 [Psilocybe cyanescens]|uniref:BHLH domain-containing protein n=1 Tax=Psilocybe cyanescens TaxID=93625 RepID=A0A409WJV4_PSICY|nr:hypothetical protein CVT25_010675 [Psilocybe cyanescens]
MPEAPKDLYAASCNPPRRAKRTNVSVSSAKPTATPTDIEAHSTPSHSQLRAILPMRAYTPRESTTAAEIEPPPAPAKRGRKPGPLSRSAREAQRRLNHSIIEKARRTKINDALATLKQLVPANYGQPPKPVTVTDDERGDEDEDDDDYEDGSGKSKSKPKPKPKVSGKKEEKEKEFKLEILVRTVAFLQDLLARVAILEATTLTSTPTPAPELAPAPPAPTPALAPSLTSIWPTCPNCSAEPGSATRVKKRKRLHTEDEDAADDSYHPHQQQHHSGRQCAPNKSSRPAKILRRSSLDLEPELDDRTPTYTNSQAQNESSERLPPISSWLPDQHPSYNGNSMIDPQLFPTVNSRARSHSSTSPVGVGPLSTPMSYLPSPPSSTHFDPVRSSTIPPLLNLGPVATAAMVSSSTNSSSSASASSSDSNKSGARSISKMTDANGASTSGTSSVRTPEDESAASLLLQISTSPTFRPVTSSSLDPSASSPLSPSGFWLHASSDLRGSTHSGSRHAGRGGESESGSRRRSHPRAQAQTPSSLLGLNGVLHGR